ncbi:MAG TPA: YjjG family noncanonical pyrimidine nucleotidase [Oscillospiraceae bacterium]|nr:YjjG family noncanonical pyrimidine nucleotidase [Oscillospiraceae bacterium]
MYKTVLLDADNTLFDFDRSQREALRLTFASRGYPYNPETVALYDRINKELWSALARGETTQEKLTVERFARFIRLLGGADDPAAMNRDYLDCLGEQSFPTEGAEEVCRELSAHCRLALVTNGVTSVQKARLASSPLARFFGKDVYISQELGVSKPQRAYFDLVLEKMGISDRPGVLMVGDSLETDIAGGAAAGLDTCWFNPGAAARGGAEPTYEIRILKELNNLVIS